MAIRKDVEFTVAADGRSVTPTVPQDGGVQGEHNATRVIFHVGENSVWENPGYTVYIECEDNAGNIDTTEPLAVEGGQVAVLLPQAWTQYGGISTLRLVAEGADGTIAYMAEGAVRFTSRQNASRKVDGLLKGRMAEMERRAEAALTAAEAAEKSADQAAEHAMAAAGDVSAMAQGVYEAETRIHQRETNAVDAANAARDAANRAAADAESVLMHASSAGQAAVNAEEQAKAALSAAKQASDEIEAARDTLGGYVVITSQYAVKSEQSALAAERAAEEAKRIEEKIGSAALPPLKFTVTKSEGGQYTSSKTYQELSDALAEGRTLVCVLGSTELPLVSQNAYGIEFAADIGGVQYYVSFDSNSSRFSVNILAPSIKIGDQMWGGDDAEFDIDFTEVINEMIEGKVSKIATAANLGVINVRDPKYGAKGDGVTDDTNAIQAALHKAEESGLPLYIPAGHYLVSKTITTYKEKDMQSNTLSIFGAGMNTLFTTTENFDGDYVFYIDYKRDQPGMLWVRDFAIDLNADVSGIYFHKMGMKSVVENLWITFKRVKQEGEAVREGIFCDKAVVSTFQRIKVFGNTEGYRQGNCGIVLRKMFSVKVIDCDVAFCGWGIYLSTANNVIVESCRVDENEYGVFQNSSTELELDTRAYPYDKNIPAVDQFCGVAQNLTIRKNRFEGNNQAAIYLVSFSVGTLNYLMNHQVSIADNYFSGLGNGTAMHTDREVFRKAIRLGRCVGVSIVGNLFKGDPYDGSNATVSRTQNISMVSTLLDITLRDNVAIPQPVGLDEAGNEIVVKSNHQLHYEVERLGLLNDIELNQTTRGDVSVRRNKRVDITTGGTVDVSGSNVACLSDGVTVSAISIANSTALATCQEVTFIATGASATVKNGGKLHLNGGVDFAMGQYDTLTMVSTYHGSAVRWVEKSRSVNSMATLAEEG